MDEAWARMEEAAQDNQIDGRAGYVRYLLKQMETKIMADRYLLQVGAIFGYGNVAAIVRGASWHSWWNLPLVA